MKHFRYLRYLIRHKWFVFRAGLVVGVPLWRLIIHDWSKFMPCEWLPYANYFYGRPKDSKNWCQLTFKDAFDTAWLHHQHFNPHHWQHWVLREDSGETKKLLMPEHFAREMAADWLGAGRAITGKWESDKWYQRNKEIIQLHPNTRFAVELWIVDAVKQLRGDERT